MGLDVDPKPGFDHWACFRGQGTYFNPELNVNGTLQTLEGFTDDVTTRQACDWIASAPDRPSLTILGYKSCHSPFDPAPRAANLLVASESRSPRPSTSPPLIDRLESIGQLDDTVVIFTTDNGFLLHEHGLYDKRAMYEESIRVPLLVRYPRLIRQGRRVDEMTSTPSLAKSARPLR